MTELWRMVRPGLLFMPYQYHETRPGLAQWQRASQAFRLQIRISFTGETHERLLHG